MVEVITIGTVQAYFAAVMIQINIGRCLFAFTITGRGNYGAAGAGPLIFFGDDIDQPGVAIRVIFGGRRG
jgi:hypothetical protein